MSFSTVSPELLGRFAVPALSLGRLLPKHAVGSQQTPGKTVAGVAGAWKEGSEFDASSGSFQLLGITRCFLLRLELME